MGEQPINTGYPLVLNERDMEEFVMSHLRDRPTAMDDLRGIAEHWFARRQIQVELPLLVAVLKQLVAAGKLEEIGRTRPSYRLKR